MTDQMPLIRALKRAMDLGMDPSSLMSLLTPEDIDALKAEWAKAYAAVERVFGPLGGWS